MATAMFKRAFLLQNSLTGHSHF